MLTETAAFSLLIGHASILRHGIILNSYLTGNTDIEDLREFAPLTVNHQLLTPSNAPRLRLALDLLNTLCACDGFGPTSNQRFWRRVLLEFLLFRHPGNQASRLDHELPPFDGLAFSRFEFGMLPSWSGPKASEFWREMISCGVQALDAADVHREREALARLLGPHVTKPVRPLLLSLMPPSLGGGKVPAQVQWETITVDTIVRGMADLDQQRQVSTALGLVLSPFSTLGEMHLHITPVQVTTACIHRNHAPSELQKATRLMQAGRLVVVDAILVGASLESQRKRPVREIWDTVHTLGRLLRVDYFGEKPIHSLTMLPNGFNHQVLGAFMSVVPYSRVVQRAQFTLLGKYEKLLGLAWLAYAAYHPKRRPQQKQDRLLKDLTIHHCELNTSEVQYLDSIIRTGMPLRDVVGVVLRDRYGPRANVQVDCFSLGVTAALPQGTLMFSEPGRHGAPYELTTLDGPEELDVVAHLTKEGYLGVVYPGFGLVWVGHTMVDLKATGYPSTKKRARQASPTGELLIASSLRLDLRKHSTRHTRYSRPQSPLPLFLGRQLRALTLLNYSPLAREDLDQILSACPSLWRLEIRRCLIDSLWPLLDAYLTDQCRVSSLSLASNGSGHGRALETPVVPTDVFGPIMETLCDATHPLTLRLRELNVDLRETAFEDTNVRHLMRALRTGTTKLEKLVVKTYATSSAHVARELGRFRDQLLVDSSLTRLAFFSVLRSRGLWVENTGPEGLANQRLLRPDTIDNIFGFTGGSVVRRVSWIFRPRT